MASAVSTRLGSFFIILRFSDCCSPWPLSFKLKFWFHRLLSVSQKDWPSISGFSPWRSLRIMPVIFSFVLQIFLIWSSIVTLSLVSKIVLLFSNISPSLSFILTFGNARSIVSNGLANSLVFIDLHNRIYNWFRFGARPWSWVLGLVGKPWFPSELLFLFIASLSFTFGESLVRSTPFHISLGSFKISVSSRTSHGVK